MTIHTVKCVRTEILHLFANSVWFVIQQDTQDEFYLKNMFMVADDYGDLQQIDPACLHDQSKLAH